MDKSSIFLKSLSDMSQESLRLDKEFNEGRKLKFKGAPSDPFLSNFNKSAAMTRLVMSHIKSEASSSNSLRTMPKYNKNSQRSIRLNQSKNHNKQEDQEKLHKIQTKYVNQMIEKNHNLIQKLDSNYDKLNEKLQKTRLYGGYKANDQSKYYKSRLKYDFTDVVTNPDEYEKQSQMLERFCEPSKYESNISKSQLIEVKNAKNLQEQLIDAIKLQDSKVKKIDYSHDAEAFEEQKLEMSRPKPSMRENKLIKIDLLSKNESKIEEEVISDESDGVPEPTASPTEKRSKNKSEGSQFNLNLRPIKEENKSNNKKATVADAISFCDDSSENDVDELEDEIDDLVFSSSKPMLRKQKTSVPEDLKLKCKPSELLDDFFNDPNEKPLKKLDVSNGKFVKHRSELVQPVQSLKRKPNAFDLAKEMNKHKNKDESKTVDKSESKKTLKNILSSDSKQKHENPPQETPSKPFKIEPKEDQPESKNEDTKPESVSKFAAKTFYGVKPIDMVKQFEKDKAEEQEKSQSLKDIEKTRIDDAKSKPANLGPLSIKVSSPFYMILAKHYLYRNKLHSWKKNPFRVNQNL